MKCPNCGSENIEDKMFKEDGEEIECYLCKDCGKWW